MLRLYKAAATNDSFAKLAFHAASVSARAFSPNMPSFPQRFVLWNVNRFAVCEEL